MWTPAIREGSSRLSRFVYPLSGGGRPSSSRWTMRPRTRRSASGSFPPCTSRRCVPRREHSHYLRARMADTTHTADSPDRTLARPLRLRRNVPRRADHCARGPARRVRGRARVEPRPPRRARQRRRQARLRPGQLYRDGARGRRGRGRWRGARGRCAHADEPGSGRGRVHEPRRARGGERGRAEGKGRDRDVERVGALRCLAARQGRAGWLIRCDTRNQILDKKGKKKKGTLGVGNGSVFFASDTDKVGCAGLGPAPGRLAADAPAPAPALPFPRPPCSNSPSRTSRRTHSPRPSTSCSPLSARPSRCTSTAGARTPPRRSGASSRRVGESRAEVVAAVQRPRRSGRGRARCRTRRMSRRTGRRRRSLRLLLRPRLSGGLPRPRRPRRLRASQRVRVQPLPAVTSPRTLSRCTTLTRPATTS